MWLVLSLACGIDNRLSGGLDPTSAPEAQPEAPEPGRDSGAGPIPGETGVAPSACTEQHFPREALPANECRSVAGVTDWHAYRLWTNPAPGDVAVTPAVGHLTDDDGDGAIGVGDVPDVAVLNREGHVWVLSGDDGRVHWRWDADTVGSPMSPAIGDLDGDGRPELVASGWNFTVALQGHDGSELWRATPRAMTIPTGAPALADLDADGAIEVVLGAVILDGATGAFEGTGGFGTGSGFGDFGPTGVAADVDQDGDLEAVVANALYDVTGDDLWHTSRPDAYVAVADFDGDPFGEIVTSGAGVLSLLEHDGTLLWSRTYTGDTSGPPTVADFDGDGSPDIGVAGTTEYRVVDAEGSLLWEAPTDDDSSGHTTAVAFDFDVDGAAEVVYADENDVWIFDGTTGDARLRYTAHSSLTFNESPAVADVDGDGHGDIVFTSWAHSGPETGVTVLRNPTWASARPIWNQHGYSVSNIEDDGRVPREPATNWLTWNTFRAADATAVPIPARPIADLLPHIHDVCMDACPEGTVSIWVSVGNQGELAVTDDFTVEVFQVLENGSMLLASVPWAADVDAGSRSEAIRIDVSGVTGPLLDVGARVVAPSLEQCDETDEEVRWGATVCP